MEQESPAEFARRAVLTGMVLGAALPPCNAYSGLKTGWPFNMSTAAGLIAGESLIDVGLALARMAGEARICPGVSAGASGRRPSGIPPA